MEFKLSEDQLKRIENEVLTQLLKRGINTTFRVFEQDKERGFIKMVSEYFQTYPVIFANMRVQNFSSFLTKNEELSTQEDSIYNIQIGIDARYWEFDGGENGTRLFTFWCSVSRKGWVGNFQFQ